MTSAITKEQATDATQKVNDFITLKGGIDAACSLLHKSITRKDIENIAKGSIDKVKDDTILLLLTLPPRISDVTPEQVLAWKAEHGMIFSAFAELNGKVVGCYFKKPTRVVLSSALAFYGRKDTVSAGQVLVNSAFVGGADFLKKDETELTAEEDLAAVAIFSAAIAALMEAMPNAGGLKN